MGHYASEMMCNKCGQTRCGCPPKPDPELNKWLVDDDLMVMLVSTYDEKYKQRQTKYGPIDGNAWARRMNKELFVTKEEALNHRVVVADKQIEQAKVIATNAGLDLIRLVRRKKEMLG